MFQAKTITPLFDWILIDFDSRYRIELIRTNWNFPIDYVKLLFEVKKKTKKNIRWFQFLKCEDLQFLFVQSSYKLSVWGFF